MVQNVQTQYRKREGIGALSISIDGDISFKNNNMESNLNNSVYKASDLKFQTSVYAPKCYLTSYQKFDNKLHIQSCHRQIF